MTHKIGNHMLVVTCRTQNPDTPRAVRVGRRKAGRLGGAGPAGWDADGFVRAGHNRPSFPPGHRIQLSCTSLRKYEHGNSYVNR